MRSILLPLALIGAPTALAQNVSNPPTFRLVMPSGSGSILVDTTGGWKVDHSMLTNRGKRPVVQLNNAAAGIEVSYILDHDPPYYKDSQDCLNDTLDTLMKGPLAKATIKNKSGEARPLKGGETLHIGSYLIEKEDNLPLNQQNVFGFIAHDNTCATIHLSRTPFKSGDEKLFDSALNSFQFEPNYIPTKADYAVMASLLPPGMARAYNTTFTETADAGPRKSTGQSPDQSLSFALAGHPGYLHIDAPNFVISELSAKPNGNEFGIRADDAKLTHAQILGFLFLPSPPQPNAAACRDWMMKSEQAEPHGYRKLHGQREIHSVSGVPIALVDYEQSKQPGPFAYVRRAFVASGDLCADIEIISPAVITADANDVVLESLTFDPSRQPNFFAKFRYATVLYDHHAYAAAALVFESAISLTIGIADATQWRRVATDQASMSYGMAGDLKHSRAINEAAIAKDPDYPLYYYNLACADAEAGNAKAAQEHLKQAYARSANTINGEAMPIAAKDDSFLKLRGDKQFWTFVQSLPAK